jgi:hypothetical protein
MLKLRRMMCFGCCGLLGRGELGLTVTDDADELRNEDVQISKSKCE